MPGRSDREPRPGFLARPPASGSPRTADTSPPSSSSRAFARRRSPSARGRACASSRLESALRISLQVHVPGRMRRRAALRADDHVLPIHLLVKERQRSELPALRSPRDEEQRRQRAGAAANGRIPQPSSLGIGEVELHVVLDPLRHFRRGHPNSCFSLMMDSLLASSFSRYGPRSGAKASCAHKSIDNINTLAPLLPHAYAPVPRP